MPVTYYLASKFEALNSRGGTDYRGAKDFEDIIYVVNSCLNLKEEIDKADDQEVKNFLVLVVLFLFCKNRKNKAEILIFTPKL